MTKNRKQITDLMNVEVSYDGNILSKFDENILMEDDDIDFLFLDDLDPNERKIYEDILQYNSNSNSGYLSQSTAFASALSEDEVVVVGKRKILPSEEKQVKKQKLEEKTQIFTNILNFYGEILTADPSATLSKKISDICFATVKSPKLYMLNLFEINTETTIPIFSTR
ncbi:MAG: hypothetical protein FJ368_02490 [Pelagibacterales bacterium]|nr:hypothetical protein [Pelagibacterales bacterium]